jgi:hypothetical protein
MEGTEFGHYMHGKGFTIIQSIGNCTAYHRVDVATGDEIYITKCGDVSAPDNDHDSVRYVLQDSEGDTVEEIEYNDVYEYFTEYEER